MKRIHLLDSEYSCMYKCYPYTSCTCGSSCSYHIHLARNNHKDTFLFNIITIASNSYNPPVDYYAAYNVYRDILFTNTNFRIIKKQVQAYLIRSSTGIMKLLKQLYNNTTSVCSSVIDRKTLGQILFKSYELDDDIL